MAQMFANAVAYEEMMGRWSKRLAVLFLDFVRIGDADKILDVGCGTGSLVQSILDRTRRAQIVGIDPAQAFIDYSRAHFPDARVIFDCGSALKLSYPDASFDHALSLLVFQFLQQPGTAAYEMRQEMSDLFWEECVRLDPGAEEKAQRPKVCNQIGQLSELWRATGFEGVEEITLEMRTDFTCFDDFWLPYTKGVGPQGMYVASLSPERREVLRDALRKRLVGDRDRPFSLRAAALAVRGTVPH